MRKNQQVQTPKGLARITRFPMLQNFIIGVQLRAEDGSWTENYPKPTVERWIREGQR